MKLFSPLSRTAIGSAIMAFPSMVFAQVYNGGGINAGIAAAGGLGLATGSPFQIILNVLRVVLNLMAFVAVIMIIIAGIYMIVSFGNETNKDKAKKIILYTLIGLVIILFSRVMVNLVTVYLYGVAH